MKDIKKRLKQIKHPEMDLDIVELGMIGKVRENDEKVTIQLRLPFRRVPMKREIMDRIREALGDRVVEIKPYLMNRKHKAEFFELAGENWNR
ncbi:MAG: iron-sulfur cluster assembly protein [Thermoplasmatota archaeon]